MTNKIIRAMKKSLIFLIATCLTISLWGQTNDTVVQQGEEKTPSIQDELWDRITEQTLQLASKEKTIIRLKEDSVAMQVDITQKKGRIEELEREIAEANKAAEKSKKEYETIKQAVLSKDAVLYKQCLLYPLERRYNPALIADALSTVNVFAGLGQMSDKFEEYRNTYQPLLNQYEQYNQQLLAFLEGCIEYITIREDKMGESGRVSVPKDKWLNEMNELSYYKECYIGKDNPPFKSIIYLDEIIDDFKSVIEQKGDVKSDLQKLVKKLEPKKN